MQNTKLALKTHLGELLTKARRVFFFFGTHEEIGDKWFTVTKWGKSLHWAVKGAQTVDKI